MRSTLGFALLLVGLTAGCARSPHPTVVTIASVAPVQPGPVWRGTATAEDLARIDGLDGKWQRAIASVPARLKPRLTAEGPLLRPGAALDAPTLTPGSYHCRLVRLGGRRGVMSFKSDFCYIENSADKLSFTKQTGENLPGGWLFEDGGKRLVFLGTKRPPNTQVAPPYGEVPDRDVAGVIERVAPFRWRMVLPQAGGGAELDIYELTPVIPDAPSGAAR